MKIQTFSIVAGTRACDASCPFCITKQTGIMVKPGKINVRNFRKAARLAEIGGTTTVLISGEGEPTLYPLEISEYLRLIQQFFKYPLIEIQTNAMQLGVLAVNGTSVVPQLNTRRLQEWYTLGLDTVAISVVDIRKENNQKIYHKDYPDLPTTIKFLRKLKFNVRLCVMMLKGMVDCKERVREVIDFCKKHDVFQLTVRPISKSDQIHEGGEKAADFVNKHSIPERDVINLEWWIEKHGTQLRKLMHGEHSTKIFDVFGQNVCPGSCMTMDPNSEDIRTLVFYSDGRIVHDWGFKESARLL